MIWCHGIRYDQGSVIRLDEDSSSLVSDREGIDLPWLRLVFGSSFSFLWFDEYINIDVLALIRNSSIF